MCCFAANNFTTTPIKLTGDEQKVVKTTAFDLQMSPASPDMKFYKRDRVREKHFGVVRMSSEAFIKPLNVAMAIDCLIDAVTTAVRSTTINTTPLKNAYKTISYKNLS